MTIQTSDRSTEKLVDLGLAETRVPAGTHICQIYSDEEECDDSLRRFLLSGLRAGECTACFSDGVDKSALEEYFARQGVSLADAQDQGALSLSGSSEVYFQDDCFDPDRMLGRLRDFYARAMESNFTAARAIGEMNSEISQIRGGHQLLDYEARVSILLRDHPVTAVCQYKASQFDGAMIMDLLKVHPMMIVRGSVLMNPFHIQPEEWLQHS